jgi:hypothetical protein
MGQVLESPGPIQSGSRAEHRKSIGRTDDSLADFHTLPPANDDLVVDAEIVDDGDELIATMRSHARVESDDAPRIRRIVTNMIIVRHSARNQPAVAAGATAHGADVAGGRGGRTGQDAPRGSAPSGPENGHVQRALPGGRSLIAL